MKNTNNNKKVSTKKESDNLIPLVSHSSNEEKSLKKLDGENSEFSEINDDVDLSKVRISQKNLVYVIGLSNNIAKEETLLKNEYFGQYGRISKIVVYKNNSYNKNQKYSPSLSAYLTFSDEKEASLAIYAVDGFEIHEKTLHCSYGTTKYCSYFLRDQQCPNRYDCVYMHSISKDHEYYYLNNHKNGTDDQKNSILNVLRKYKKEFFNYTTTHNKSDVLKTVFPCISKTIFDLNHIFTNEIGIPDESNGIKKIPKNILSKSHSTNSEDKPASSQLAVKKDSTATKTKPNNHKPINTVDWEDDFSTSNTKKDLNSSEKKKPEINVKSSEELKSYSLEKQHSQEIFSNYPSNQNLSEKNEEEILKLSKSVATEESKGRKIDRSLEEEMTKNTDFRSMNESMEITIEENDSKLSPKERILPDFIEKMKINGNEHNSAEFKKTSNETNEKKEKDNNCKNSEDTCNLNKNLYNQLNCNDIEMKIIKNMLNETNQRSRFSFVQSEEKKNNEKKENSLKEILLSSLKLNDFKRSCSLSCYSQTTDTDILGVNLLNIYSNKDQITQEYMIIQSNNKINVFNDSSATKKL